MNVIKKRKASLWLAPLFLILIPITLISIVIGFLWAWVFSGFEKGGDIAAKLCGFETNEEIIRRVMKEPK